MPQLTPEDAQARSSDGGSSIVAYIRDARNQVVAVSSLPEGKGLLTGGFCGRDGANHLQDRATSARRKGEALVDEPLHLMMRDVTSVNEVFSDRLHSIAPAAAAILDSYNAGKIRGGEALRKADRAFADELEKAVARFFAGGRTDADSVFLHLETVYTMQKVLERRYKSPTIFDNAFPVTVFGTTFDTYRQVVEEYTAALARVGARDVMASPLASVKRSEVSRNLVPIDMSGHVDFWELRQIEEVRRNNPGPAGSWDILRRRLKAAEKGVQRSAGWLAAFGDPERGIPGLLSDQAITKIPRSSCDFTSATPKTAYDALNSLLELQFANVGEDEDLRADSIALPPGDFMRLGHLQYSDNYPRGLLQLFMENNPQIRGIYQLRELAPDAAERAQLKKHKMSDAKADRFSGGLKVDGTIRKAVVAYRKDAEVCELVYGHELMSITHPPNNGRQLTQLVQSFGGLVPYVPEAMLVGYSSAV